jgi:hypothetical protein
MGSPAGLGFGVRFLMDGHQNFMQESTGVYLRIQNSDDSTQEYADLGFEVQVSGIIASGAGTQDLKISPPPSVRMLNLHEIGIMGTQLQFGAIEITISHTWVLGWMQENGYTNPLAVFRDRSRVIGIVFDNQLYTIESITHEDVGVR